MKKNITTSNQDGAAMDSSTLLSSTIDLLRFPLAIMVIFIHMFPTTVNIAEANFSPLSWQGIYNIIAIIVTHVICQIAVPTFFFISGFLFFNNFRTWSWDGYRKKMRSRVKTLIIPYIIWNLLPLILDVVAYIGLVILGYKSTDNFVSFMQGIDWHVLYDYHDWGVGTNWLGESLSMYGPYDLPLWFLRDLIVITLLTPVIYIGIKKLKLLFIATLFLAYISRIWTVVPGFSITAFFYFSTGAYFALNSINIVPFVWKRKYLLVSASVILMIIATICCRANNTYFGNIIPFFTCIGVFTAFIIASWCIRKYNASPSKLLVSSCFFIYALHENPCFFNKTPNSLTKDLLHKVIPGSSSIEDIICYLLAPFATALVCIVTLMILRKIMPRFALILSGNK